MDRLKLIKRAVAAQAMDEGLWAVPAFGTQPIGEAYLQQALRALHRVVEDGDMQALALIEECAECTQHITSEGDKDGR
jgi:hypothetical protein